MNWALRRSFRWNAAVVFLGVLLLVTGCEIAAPTSKPAANLHMYDVDRAPLIEQSPSTLGVADSDLYGLPPDRVADTMRLLKSARVDNVRLLVPWAAIEPEQGVYDWTMVDRTVDAAVAAGVTILATLNSPPAWAVVPGQRPITGRPRSSTDFGRFAGAVARHYLGKISAYEIWNEQNATPFFEPGPDAAGYVDLLRAAYPAIKAVDPLAVVVSGGLGPLVDRAGVAIDAVEFVDAMYAAGAKNYFDALAYHPYQYEMKFSEAGYHPDSPINQLAGIRASMLHNGDLDKRIWATEYGEPSAGVGEQQQADYLEDMLRAWRTIPYAGPLYVYSMRDRDSSSLNPEDTFGIFRSDGSAKPAEEVIRTRVVDRSSFIEPVGCKGQSLCETRGAR